MGRYDSSDYDDSPNQKNVGAGRQLVKKCPLCVDGRTREETKVTRPHLVDLHRRVCEMRARSDATPTLVTLEEA